MSYATGSLVRARNREWVVLPESSDDLLMLRPLGGTDAEITGILTDLEPIESATFALPDPSDLGDYRSARMLRDALRLGFRSSAGPFRSIGRIGVTPRPYQLVPLLMALKLDPVRLLIADDVGIGKTIEAALIAKELLEQGDSQRMCVLCPPHLAEQWQQELAEKFHIDAELVLSSTAARLERGLLHGQSLFDVYPNTVVSIDFIKGDRRRDDFIRACPDFVIVDEAHTCADAGEGNRSARHQRHQLVHALSQEKSRHLVLVTATPHSGKEGAFRSLLCLLDDEFLSLPDELTGDANRHHRERLAQHLVQRRRPDIRHYLDADTAFPSRRDAETTYKFSASYKTVFDDVLAFARETVRDPSSGAHRQRVRWWSALGLLRALASSPAAAAATMRTRAATADTDSVEAADEIGRQTVLDMDDTDEAVDVVPGSDTDSSSAGSRRLRAFADDVDQLRGDQDAKLMKLIGIVRGLIDDGFQPIVFCRFIDTAEYVAAELRDRLPKKLGVEIEAITGRLPGAERVQRIEALSEAPKRVLVATDCLSEGINLQNSFNAVVHYDLPWNPTRLEQREGRVDRFGQVTPEVRIVTYFGDNQIDETVLDVLVRKHRKIRSALGISLPIPGDTGDVINALAESVLLRSDSGIEERLPGLDEFLRPETEQLHLAWDEAAERETRSRSIFAQETIRPAEVAAEVEAMQEAVGSGANVGGFVVDAIEAYGGLVTGTDPITVDLTETGRGIRDAVGPVGAGGKFRGRFDLPVPDGVLYLSRTNPIVSGLAGHVLDQALDSAAVSEARRCGVIRTNDVERRTTLLLCRFRLQLVAELPDGEHPMLAEDAVVMGFTGPPERPQWLTPEDAEALLGARPSGNVDGGAARDFVGEVLAAEAAWRPALDDEAARRAEALVDAHTRVRKADARRGVRRGARYRAVPQLPVDVLGVYVHLPAVTS
jgi:hypothetical protein